MVRDMFFYWMKQKKWMKKEKGTNVFQICWRWNSSSPSSCFFQNSKEKKDVRGWENDFFIECIKKNKKRSKISSNVEDGDIFSIFHLFLKNKKKVKVMRGRAFIDLFKQNRKGRRKKDGEKDGGCISLRILKKFYLEGTFFLFWFSLFLLLSRQREEERNPSFIEYWKNLDWPKRPAWPKRPS